MARLSAAVLIVFIAVAAPCAAQAPGAIKGKVNLQGKPLEGAVVYVYSGSEGGFSGEAAFTAGPTVEDGVFEVEAPPGRYYLLAKKTGADDGAVSKGDLFAYYGGNPVSVPEGGAINIGINCGPVMDDGVSYTEGGTGIRGTVYIDGEPLARARVTLYRDGDTIFRGIGYASTLANQDGRFAFSLSEGSYYVIARKRAGRQGMGPLAPGDSFAYCHENPVEVKDGSYSVITMSAVTKLEKVKEGGQAVTLDGTVKAGETVISGVVTDGGGGPVQGVQVSAYRDSMMIYKPDFISNVTGADGAYTLTLSGGGEYFIMARDTIGGPAEKGDLLGRYAGNEDHSVIIKTGEKMAGIDIAVETVQ